MFIESTLFAALAGLLATQPDLRAALARHAGRQARIRLPLFALTFMIDAEGNLAAADPTQDCAAEIALSPDVLLALAVGTRDALKRAEVTGDGTLAADLLTALDAFDWALALRPVLGDVLAARAAQAVDAYVGWRGRALEAVGRSLAEYATYEADLLADPGAVRHFVAEVDELRDDAARLEARLERLEQGHR